MISAHSHNVTSSPASLAGPGPSSSQAGQQMSLFGPDPAHASPSPVAACKWAARIRDIYGLRSVASSTSAALQLSLGSRLQAALEETGSPEYELTWRQWDMQSGPRICALRASARLRSANGSIGWPSTVATEARQGFQDRSRGKLGSQESLSTQVVLQMTYPPHHAAGRRRTPGTGRIHRA